MIIFRIKQIIASFIVVLILASCASTNLTLSPTETKNVRLKKMYILGENPKTVMMESVNDLQVRIHKAQ